jgi:hypothetical protein
MVNTKNYSNISLNQGMWLASCGLRPISQKVCKSSVNQVIKYILNENDNFFLTF